MAGWPEAFPLKEMELVQDYMAKNAKRPINWQILASKCRFRPAKMARKLGCSVRTLERQFKRENHKTVLEAGLEWKSGRIVELVRARKSGKEIIGEVDFAHVTGLSRYLKSHHRAGLCALRRSG